MALPQPVTGCYVVKQGGAQPYVYENVNVLANGGLYFVEDQGKTIDFQVKSLLVESGGVVQAGSSKCPFGSGGGRLEIGLYGDDPSMLGTVSPAPAGIQCMTAPMDSPSGCFPKGRDPDKGKFYCTVSDSDDPCSSTAAPAQDADNFLLERYGNLSFDPTPWGYKVLGVSYGGALRLFGYKGAKPLQGPGGVAWGVKYDANDHCVVPTADQSNLDAAEMKAWANLSGSSWARLEGQAPGTPINNVAQTLITLDRSVNDWKEGDQIVIGTTDWYPNHSEIRTINAVMPVSTTDTRTQLSVDALQYPHFTKIFDVNDLNQQFTAPPNRTAADLRATVGLLSRSIQIRSLGTNPQMTSTDPGFPDVAQCLYKDGTAPSPDCYFGGHVMIRQGFRSAQFQGVEFKQLGQGGRQGHYPVHFHLDKSTAYTENQAFLKDSSVWDSMTRFVVLHGTQDVTVARNVGYLSVGHGYYLEDGSEINDKLCHNLGVGARGALKEYYAAQADPKNWGPTPAVTPAASPTPPLTARFVPPILDGSCAGPDISNCKCTLPPPKDNSCTDNDVLVARSPMGSDSLMPVMFWAMNAHNEFVGNAAVGVGGFGSCYWLIGSAVSGPSFSTHKFAGLANYNAGGHQAPLLRFRGDSCTSATYALPASLELPPASGENVGYTPVDNPYLLNPDGTLKPAGKIRGLYSRPAVIGNFLPVQPNPKTTNCADSATSTTDLDNNAQACVTTVIDRFTTSFNWAQVNFGSVWLRPWFYLFANSAMTDQLFGGLTFVTAGSWVQVPPGFFDLAKNSLFVGTSHDGSSPYAKRSGPLFQVTTDDNVSNYAPCAGPKVTCNVEVAGTGYWRGGAFNPKRLINIYDGPHFADGNTFVNVGAWDCDPQPCQDKTSCETELPCGIYSSTTQPASNKAGEPVDPHKAIVIDAAIGWKQPNGFYYPPAFTYRGSAFLQSAPTPAPTPNLNQCFSFGPDDNYTNPTLRTGGCRHNVIDRTRSYITGNMIGLNGRPQVQRAGGADLTTGLDVTPIDFSTILIDLDGSLTGAVGVLAGDTQSGTCECGDTGKACTTTDGRAGRCLATATSGVCACQALHPTTSLSRNAFFDAPAQTDECLSFGLQTSPYEFVTTLVAPLAASPASSDPTYIEPRNWPDPINHIGLGTPMVAIYRQWKNQNDPDVTDPNLCGQVCDENNPINYGCTRGTFMVGPNVGQAPYLTMSLPPGLMNQSGALYYIDTSTGTLRTPAPTPTGTPAPVPTPAPFQSNACVKNRTTQMFPAPFLKNESYVVYNLFARNDSVVSYQLFVGDNVNELDKVQGRFVRVDPHLHPAAGKGDGQDSFRSTVRNACEPGQGWCKDLPVPTVTNGILTVTLDQRKITQDFVASGRGAFERCMPHDLCYFDGTRCQACASATKPEDKAQCIRQDDFLSADVNAMNHADATGQTPLDVVCHDWATFASGTTTAQEGELSLVDCPKDGCLGFAFTLPDSFVGNKTYRDVGAPLAQCFGCDAWKSDNRLVALSDSTGKLKDPLCGPPRVATDADFCAACSGEGAGSSAPTLAMSSISMSMAPPTPKPVGAPIEAAASTSGEATGALTSRTGATTKPAHASRTAPAQGVVGLPTPTPTPTPTPKPSPTPTPRP